MRGKPSVSFKSTLLNMANPKYWKRFDSGKERLKIAQGDILVSKGFEGPAMRNGRYDNMGDTGHLKYNTSNIENMDKRGGGVKKDKVGFKYMRTNSNNVGKVGESRFDILNDKGKGLDLKEKGVLSEVANLNEKSRVFKKTDKAKVSIKPGIAKNKSKKQLVFNTSNENESHSSR
ncbi:hypothetical protein ACOSQ4_010322 [Xanthoceras sorbifolium]